MELKTPPRRNKIAEEKALLRAELAALVDKVPAKVNAGSVQTTRAWLHDNKSASRAATRARASRFKLRDTVANMKAWQAGEVADA